MKVGSEFKPWTPLVYSGFEMFATKKSEHELHFNTAGNVLWGHLAPMVQGNILCACACVYVD